MPFLTKPRQAERRATVRFLCSLDAFCFPLKTDKQGCCPAEVRDVSEKGIGLILDQPLEAGTILGIEMGKTFWRRSRVLVARVVHATAQADGRWLVGCEFAFQLSGRDLKALR